jgi:membrane-associated phospholipid phosphatase
MSSTNARTEQHSGTDQRSGDAPAPIGVRDSIGPLWPSLRGPMLLAGGLFVAGLLVIPVDGPISDAAIAFRRDSLGGDIERELEALQQFGQGATTLLAAWAIWLLDPARRRRLLDWLAAAALAALVAYPTKMLVGRPRPKFGDPGHFPGPFGAYPLGEDVGVRHGWEVWADISSDLWSMPSSHTVYAVVAAVALATLYPRLRPLAVTMACLVGVARVLFGAHYPSDVLVGAAVGVAAASLAMRRCLGVRLLDAIWCRFIDRNAEPAWPAVVDREGRGV